jgi:hypothetical protein
MLSEGGDTLRRDICRTAENRDTCYSGIERYPADTLSTVVSKRLQIARQALQVQS